MQRKVMISCAVTGSADTPGRNPAVPVTPAQIAQSALDAAKAGAAIVHIHVRHVVELKPDICSLDMGSMNMGPHVFINTPKHLEAMATAIRDAGVLPELEVFETGHLLLAKRLLESGHIKPPGMFQICLGIAWAQPATPEAMSYMKSLLPVQSPWFAFGISLHQFPMVAQAVLLGGHPRVGLEDNIYLEKGKLAPSNAALVEKAAKIVEILGDNVATPPEARQILGLSTQSATQVAQAV